jgi:hypothetical protein
MGFVSTLNGAEDTASLNLNFVNQKYKVSGANKTFSDLVTFTRASVGGRWNASGVYEVLPNDQPRFDYDPITKVLKGLLVEEARTNSLTNSNSLQPELWTMTAATLSPNTVLSPDGTLTGSKIVENTATAIHYTDKLSSSGTVAAGTKYTISAFLKAGERTRARLVGVTGVSAPVTADAFFDLSNGTVISGAGDPKITDVGGGWYRVSTVMTVDNGPVTPRAYYQLVSTGTTFSYAGDGSSGMYIWGPQLEIGSFPTSYIPTNATFTSRASTATYFDANSVMQTAGVNVARSTYKYDNTGVLRPIGLMVESAATNLGTYSNTPYTFPTLVRTTYNDVGQQFVDGVTPMRLLREDTSATTTHYATPYSQSLAANTTYTGSYFVKAAGRTKLRLFAVNTGSWIGGNPQVLYDLVAGTAVGLTGATGTVEKVSSDVFRITWTATVGASGISSSVYPTLADDAGASNYTGDGVSGIYIGGYQLEVGSVATSYINNQAVFVSRASTATYTDENEVIRTAAVNVARDNAYRRDSNNVLKPIGLLTETTAKTNAFTYNNVFTNPVWLTIDTTIQLSKERAPDGSLMHSLTQGSAGTGNSGRNAVTYSGGEVTGSIYLKRGNHDWVNVYLTDTSAGAAGGKAWFNLANGGIGTIQTIGTATGVSATITPCGNDTYRVSVTCTMPGTTATLFTYGVTGDNTLSRVSGGVRYIWGAQLEVGAVANSYTPSTDTFTSRTTDATYIDSLGIVRTVAANVARSNAYDYDSEGILRPIGLLLEPARTNLIAPSNDFASASWIKGTGVSVSTDGGLAPDGSIAQKFTLSGTVSHHMAVNLSALAVNSVYTISVWAKAVGANVPSFQLAYYDNGTQVVGSSANLSVGEWKRYSITITTPGTAPAAPQIRLIGYSGGLDGSVFYLYNAQVELGAYPTSDIVTTTVAKTRAADVSSSTATTRAADVVTFVQNTRAADVSSSVVAVRAVDTASVNNLSPWFNAVEGTLLSEFNQVTPFTSGTYRRPAALSGATTGNEISHYLDAVGGNMRGFITNGSVGQMDSLASGTPVYVPGDVRRAATGYMLNNSAYATAGLVGTDSVVTIPTIASLTIGSGPVGTYRWNGYIRSINYFPKRLTNSELQALTL